MASFSYHNTRGVTAVHCWHVLRPPSWESPLAPSSLASPPTPSSLDTSSLVHYLCYSCPRTYDACDAYDVFFVSICQFWLNAVCDAFFVTMQMPLPMMPNVLVNWAFATHLRWIRTNLCKLRWIGMNWDRFEWYEMNWYKFEMILIWICLLLLLTTAAALLSSYSSTTYVLTRHIYAIKINWDKSDQIYAIWLLLLLACPLFLHSFSNTLCYPPTTAIYYCYTSILLQFDELLFSVYSSMFQAALRGWFETADKDLAQGKVELAVLPLSLSGAV
jgi:hypothetical protein